MGLVAVYFISLYVPLISAYTKYPVYVVKCGGKPIIAKRGKRDNYTLPGNRFYNINFRITDYFCTEAEAKSAGYLKFPV